MTASTLELRITVAKRALSQLDSLVVTVTLANLGEPLLVPSAYDLSGALCLITRQGDRIVRVASGLTRQEMMASGRVDATPTLVNLGRGAAWSVTLDLGQAMHSPPPGAYELVAELRVPQAETAVSNAVAFDVSEQRALRASASRDNPIVDGFALLLEQDDDEPWLLRQYNTSKPLGAWYRAPLACRTPPVLARPSYFEPRSFDHFFERRVVWTDAGRVFAQTLVRGHPRDPPRSAELPPGSTLVESACDHGHGELDVFTTDATGALACHAFEATRLRERWRIPLPHRHEGPPCIVADAAAYHVAVASGGLCLAEVGRDGTPAPWQQPFNSDLRRASVVIDSVDRRILAAFWDGPNGEHTQFLEAPLDGGAAVVFYWPRAGAFRALREFAFDRAKDGTFHVLTHSRDALAYHRQDDDPVLLAPASAVPRAPLVSARPALHLGFYDAASGYEFYPFKHGALQREPSHGVSGAP